MYYDAQHPPFRPDTDVPMEIIFARDYICAQIANMAGLFSTWNPARMFCYNSLVFYNFDNQHFVEVYRLVVGLLLFRQRKGNLNDIRMSANECIYQVLSLYTAHLCNNYPELMKQLDVNQLQGVKDLTLPFQDLKAMVEVELNNRDPNQYTRWATDIVYKCKDLYTLDSNQLISDCQFTHNAMQKLPFAAKQYTSRFIFNPTGTQPLIPPNDFQPDLNVPITTEPKRRVVTGYKPVDLSSNLVSQQQFLKQKDDTMLYNQPGFQYQHDTSNQSGQVPRQLTHYEMQNGLPVPRTNEEARMITDGFDMNFPELGYFPSWHPRHLDWLKARSAKIQILNDQLALENNRRYGTPLPDHLRQQQPMQHQNVDPRFQQQPAGYHNFQQPNSLPQARFGQPMGQQFAHQQPNQPMQPYYTPDVPVMQVMGTYPNGNRVVMMPNGQQVEQMLVVPTNVHTGLSTSTGSSFTYRQPADGGNERYDGLSNAMRSTLGRWENRSVPAPPVKPKPSFTKVTPSVAVGRHPDIITTTETSPIVTNNDNRDYFHQRPIASKPAMPDISKLVNGVQRRRQDLYSTQSGPADEWAHELISNVCSEDEQIEVRGYAINSKSAEQLAFEANMSNGLPFKPNERVVTQQPILKRITYETSPKDFVARKQLTFKGGSEMDRSKHQIVKFGGVIKYPLQPKFEELKQSTDKLITTPAVVPKPEPIIDHIEQENGELEEVVIQPEIVVEDYMIYPDLLMDPNLEGAITTSKMLKLEHFRKEPEDKVFRSFGFSCELLLSNSDIDDHIDALRHTNNFKQLAVTIAKVADTNFETVDEKNDVLLVLSEIDRKLTEKTNEFLKHKLGVPTLIDEFSSDIVELRDYLVKYYHSEAYGVAFDRFEIEIMNSINTEFSDEDMKDMREGLRINNDVFTSYFPFMYSFTHINLTAEELGFSDKDFRDKQCLISITDHESLYKLVHSLDLNKFARKSPTVTDYLVTSDGVKFRIFVNYIDNETFSIAREIDG